MREGRREKLKEGGKGGWREEERERGRMEGRETKV